MNEFGNPLAIIVMGVSGSGKSTVGKLLAGRVGVPFLEGDDFHPPANIAKMRAGVPLDDEDRWPWLDRLGSAFAAALRSASVVVGSCSALKRAYRDRLRSGIGSAAWFVSLDVDRGTLAERLARRRGHYMPASLLDSQLATFEPPGQDEFAVVIRAGGLSAEQVVDLILDALRRLDPSGRAPSGPCVN